MEQIVKASQLPNIGEEFDISILAVNKKTKEAVRFDLSHLLYNDFKTTASALNNLNSRVEALEKERNKLGKASAKSIDVADGLKVCGADNVIVAEVAPNVAPNHIGQIWVQQTPEAKNIWMASDVSDTLDWKQLS